MVDWTALIPVGQVFVSPGRTISEGDFTLLTSLTWNTTIIHTDKEFMKTTEFGERILDGPSLLACAAGLSHRSGTMKRRRTSTSAPWRIWATTTCASSPR